MPTVASRAREVAGVGMSSRKRRVAVAVDVHVERLLELRGLLGHHDEDLHLVAVDLTRAGQEVDVERGLRIGALRAALEQERERYEPITKYRRVEVCNKSWCRPVAGPTPKPSRVGRSRRS
jgi:hypothetical protein